MTWLAPAYLWIKAFHILSVICWMAGLLYLPRLFVYHADTKPGSEASETFKVMERRLLRGIMTPAMIATYIFGALLAGLPGLVDWSSGWIYGKLALVAILTVGHHEMARRRKEFAADANRYSAKFYRIMNEIPAVILVGIVILVVVKPF